MASWASVLEIGRRLRRKVIVRSNKYSSWSGGTRKDKPCDLYVAARTRILPNCLTHPAVNFRNLWLVQIGATQHIKDLTSRLSGYLRVCSAKYVGYNQTLLAYNIIKRHSTSYGGLDASCG